MSPIRRFRPSALLLSLTLLAGLGGAAPRAHAQAPTLDDFLCLKGGPARKIERSLRFAPQAGLDVRDRVIGAEALKVDLKKSLGLCLPAGSSADAGSGLEPYGAKITRTRPAQKKPAAETQRVTNRFGTSDLRVKGLDDLMVATTFVVDPPPAASAAPGELDAFACYDAEPAAGSADPSPVPLTIESAIGSWQFDVRAPTRLCFPADVGGADPSAPSEPTALACYRAKLTKTKPPQKPFPRGAATTNRFGAEQLALTAAVDFCVVSDVRGIGATPTPQQTAVPTPTPTLTPPPGFTLRIDPPQTSVDIGKSVHFTATAVYDGGDQVDFTERVLWSSTAAAEAPNVAGDRGRIDAVDGGSAVISVLDEATGVTSTATGDDAVLTVNWTLERVELLPVEITRGKGESFLLRATGHFAGGYTRSIAERLIYASDTPGVGAPTNDADPAEHSRVRAVSEGTAVLSATEPLSGITSTASGDDVTFTVVGPLERCEITETVVKIGLGDYHQLTARGFYPGGFERAITQQVTWESDDPTIVSAPNTAGDRSRILPVAPGEAHVTATDPITGVACDEPSTVTVGEASSLFLQRPNPSSWLPIRASRSWHAIAVLKFPPPIGKQYVTERAVFTSSNPSIVAAPNVAGDRGRLDAVGSGTAFVKATDPVTGLVSQTIALRSLANLQSLKLPAPRFYPNSSLLSVGNGYYTSAIGEFPDGPAPLDATDVTLVSSDPSVATVTFGVFGWFVRAVGPGVTTISATDHLTGFNTDTFGQSLRLGVRGPLERIVLVPPTVTRRPGAYASFAAVGYYVGGASEVVTQDLVYESSDPAVVVALNYGGNLSLTQAVAQGTAVITAVDPVTGVRSDDTGESATVTVVGPLTRIRVSPSLVTRSRGRSFSFTAVGTDALGREINVTQGVTWSSSNTNVAVATNEEGNRSRIQSLEIGTTTISAFDPQDGISSTSSGDDATFEIDKSLLAIFLSTDDNQLKVGETIQLTCTGQLLHRGQVNLTQEVVYSSSDPSVARADNPPGDRSRIIALKPGVAVISAHDPGTGLDTTGNGRVTLIVTAP